MTFVTTSKDITALSLWRVLTGLGIGGMLAVTNAVASELSNAKHRDLCVSLMAVGYPIGAVLGGIITTQLLKQHDWRSVFYFGALETINRTLHRMGHASLSALPTITQAARKQSIGDAFAPGFAVITILVAAAYFFHITTFYFLLKWIPKIVVDMGFAPSSAASVLVWANVGGALGGGLLGLLSRRFPVKQLTITRRDIGKLTYLASTSRLRERIDHGELLFDDLLVL